MMIRPPVPVLELPRDREYNEKYHERRIAIASQVQELSRDWENSKKG